MRDHCSAARARAGPVRVRKGGQARLTRGREGGGGGDHLLGEEQLVNEGVDQRLQRRARLRTGEDGVDGGGDEGVLIRGEFGDRKRGKRIRLNLVEAAFFVDEYPPRKKIRDCRVQYSKDKFIRPTRKTVGCIC